MPTPTYSYKFHEKGYSVAEAEIEPNHIWLDIGNALGPGVIDHHSGGGYVCTVQALVQNLHLLQGLRGSESVEFHTHTEPDTDALFSIYLVRRYLAEGSLPVCIEDIVQFVSRVDIGDIAIVDTPTTLYKVICMLSDKYYDPAQLEKCFDLIDIAVQRCEAEAGFSFMDSDILEGLAGFEDVKERIVRDYDCYLADKAGENRICIATKLYLPTRQANCTSAQPVRALIWTQSPTSVFNRLWARSEGYVLTVVPQKDKCCQSGEKNILCTDTIISIPPYAQDKYTLRPLAHLLEQYEQYKEAAMFAQDDDCKRDHSRPRGRANDGSRFFAKPWRTTADPWYFTADETLVQSPFTGSLISTPEVIKIVQTFGACYVKEHHMNVLIPFTYTPSRYGAVRKLLQKQGWQASKGDGLPWMNADSQYISTFMREYKFPKNARDKHFVLLESAIAGFDNRSYCILFEYGMGVVVTAKSTILDDKHFATYEIDEISRQQQQLHDRFFAQPPFAIDGLHFMAPHFYTSIEVSSECLNMSHSALSKFAKPVSDCGHGDAARLRMINHRTAAASSCRGVALVIATDEFDEHESNKSEYRCRDLFGGEWLWMYIIALQQRYSLVEIKRSFASMQGVKNSGAAKKLREVLIDFYATSYFAAATDDELGDSIYRSWHEILKIQDLKTDVMDQINQHDQYVSEKLTAFFDKISFWLIPLVLLSTAIQTIVNGEMLLDLVRAGDFGSLGGWVAMLVPTGLLIVVLAWMRRKR